MMRLCPYLTSSLLYKPPKCFHVLSIPKLERKYITRKINLKRMMMFKSKKFGIRFGFGKRINNKGTQQDQQQKGSGDNNNNNNSNYEIKWELRPGGMLVQKRQESIGEDLISIRVSTFAYFHDLSIEATSTFGDLKMVLSLLTGLEPTQQRLLFKGKERKDDEFLHMVGVGDKDKVLLLEDPAFKDKKLLHLNNISSSCPTIIV